MLEFLPLFPLSLVVYPGESMKLHIFEPRYRQLIADCEQEGIRFGIPTVIDGKLESLATEVELMNVDKRFPGGESNVTVMGTRRFKIEEFMAVAEPKPYPGGRGQFVADSPGQEEVRDLQHTLLDYILQLHDSLGISKELVSSPEEISSFAVAHEVGMNLQQEYEVLTLGSERSRLQYLMQHLQQIIPVVRETERLKARAQLNGHYKNLMPPSF